jgi:ATP-dependent DNA helicase RecQ
MGGITLEPRTSTALHVVERILTRGMCPPLDAQTSGELGEARPAATARTRRHVWRSPDGSKAEERFLAMATELLGPERAPQLHPQVPVAALTGEPDGSRERVDFVLLANGMRFRALVFEIDGVQHAADDAATDDRDRDARLRAAGHEVIRLRAADAETGWGAARPLIRAALDRLETDSPVKDVTPVAAAQAAATCLLLVRLGLLPLSVERWAIRTEGSCPQSVAAGCRMFFRLYGAVRELYGGAALPGLCEVGSAVDSPTLAVAWDDSQPWYDEALVMASDNVPRVTMRPVWLPGRSALEPPSKDWFEPRADASSECLRVLLRHVFPDKSEFWEGQEAGVRRCLNGEDSLVLLPTGAGKSLIYQLSAVLLPGVSIVVSPLVSLMEDQVDNLRRAGIDRVSIISSSTTRAGLTERFHAALAKGAELMCYVSPERLQIASFRDALFEVARSMPVPIVVVDEAHCVSEWGHDFRPAYLMVGRMGRKLGRRGHGDVPSVVGLTGTASRAVLRDVQRELQIEDLDAVITPETFDRAELSYEVHSCRSDQKLEGLRGLLSAVPQRLGVPRQLFWQPSGHAANCGLVFAPHIRGSFGVLAVADGIREATPAAVGCYAGRFDPEEKQAAAASFKDNETQLLVATNAFGMGIDKPNVRFTVHYGFSPSLEALWQEMGRAGRDRRPARCLVLASVDDPQRARRLLSPDTSIEDVAEIMDGVSWHNADDVTRAMYFHVQSFGGISDDMFAIEELLEQLPGLGTVSTVTVRPQRRRRTGGDARRRLERALHRLIILGVCDDYTVDFKTGALSIRCAEVNVDDLRDNLIRYVDAYSRARARAMADQVKSRVVGHLGTAVLAACDLLVRFVYGTIELARRTGIRQVWEWCERGGADDSKLREGLLDYLQETEFSRDVRDILLQREFELDGWGEILEAVRSRADLAALDGALRRANEDYPDHPAVLAMVAIVSTLSPEPVERAIDSLRAALRYASERYEGQIDADELAEWSVTLLARYADQAVARDIAFALLDERSVALARRLWGSDLPAAVRQAALPNLIRALRSNTVAALDAVWQTSVQPTSVGA